MYLGNPGRSDSDFLAVFFCCWCEGVSEGNSIKSQDDQKGAWPLTPALNLSIRSPRLVKRPTFIAFHVFFLQQSFLSNLWNMEQEWPTSIYTKILLKGASAFCWILFFCIFTQLRNSDLGCWLYDMCFCSFRFDCNPGICPTSDVAEQKLITFLGEVGGSFKTPSRWWLLLWLLRVNRGNPCGWDTHLGNMRLSHLSKTCPSKNDLGWNDLPWAELWWNLRKGLARVLALSIRGIQDCIWISHDSVADLYGHFPAWQGLSLESNYTLLPWHELSRLDCFLWSPSESTGRSFFNGFSLLWYFILKTGIYLLHWIFTKNGLCDPTLCDGQVSPMSGTMPCRGIASC